MFVSRQIPDETGERVGSLAGAAPDPISFSGKAAGRLCRGIRLSFCTLQPLSPTRAALRIVKSDSSLISARHSNAVERCIDRTKAQPSDFRFAMRRALSFMSGGADAERTRGAKRPQT